MNNNIEHPQYYGGSDNPYEAIKVIEAWDLGFCLGNVIKYISRNGKKEGEAAIKDLKKAKQYLEFEISKLTSRTMKPEYEQEMLESVASIAQAGNGPTFDDLLKAKRVKLVETNATRSYLAYNDVGAAFKVSHWETTKDTLSLIPEITSDFSMWISREHFQDGKLTMTDSDIYWKWEIIE